MYTTGGSCGCGPCFQLQAPEMGPPNLSFLVQQGWKCGVLGAPESRPPIRAVEAGGHRTHGAVLCVSESPPNRSGAPASVPSLVPFPLFGGDPKRWGGEGGDLLLIVTIYYYFFISLQINDPAPHPCLRVGLWRKHRLRPSWQQAVSGNIPAILCKCPVGSTVSKKH